MLKTLLKVQFAALKASLFRSRRKQSKGGTGRTIGFAVLFLYVIICFFIMFGSMFSSICMPLHELGLGWLYFAIAGLMAFMLTFIGNVFATQTQLFDAKDNELLLSMPIAPKFILGSRMLLLLALDLGYVLLVMGPAGVVYCMELSRYRAKRGVFYHQYAAAAADGTGVLLPCRMGHLSYQQQNAQ